MSKLTVAPMEREFRLNGVKIPDPNPAASPEQVKQMLAVTYPDITTATMSGPEIEGEKALWSFRSQVGSKG